MLGRRGKETGVSTVLSIVTFILLHLRFIGLYLLYSQRRPVESHRSLFVSLSISS